jgi:glycosyltransferase involved in cell wall biosynthesis
MVDTIGEVTRLEPAGAALEVVVITHNRRDRLVDTVHRLIDLPDRPCVTVVDNASDDGTAAEVRQQFGGRVNLLQMPRNLGAAGRNVGVAVTSAPYVAFCDDDTVWVPGSLSRAVELLEASPNVGALVAHVGVGPAMEDDPICAELAASPLRHEGAPGPTLVGLMAGASVVRREAFTAAGGFDPMFGVGGEEELLALDLVSAGWLICYIDELQVQHVPAPRDAHRRSRVVVRNHLWTMWMRYPAVAALRDTAAESVRCWRDPDARSGVVAALRGAPTVLRRRHPVRADAAAALRSLRRAPHRHD